MQSSSNNQKCLFRIAIIAVAVLGLFALAYSLLAPRNESKPKDIVIPKKDTTSTKTVVKEEPTISEDFTNQKELNKRKDSIWWETEKSGKWLSDRDKGYAKERERFDKVLDQASDEELFTVLNYAIAQRYVPNRHVDPYGYMFVGITSLHRSYLIYDKLSDRKDLLRKIYPDVKVLHEYVYWGRQTGKPYPDTIVSKTILNNARKESRKMDSELVSKYFGTPLLRD